MKRTAAKKLKIIQKDMWTILTILCSTVNAKSLSLELPGQLEAWLDGKDELLPICRRELEKEEKKSSDERVALLEVGRCDQMKNPSGNIPHGRFDSEGRLEGKVSKHFLSSMLTWSSQGELVITWIAGLDREEERPDMEVAESSYPFHILLLVKNF